MQNKKMALLTPPKVKLNQLNNLFFQLCTKTCNLRCKNCYIERSSIVSTKNNKEDFIQLDKIKQALNVVDAQKLRSIYLTGGEPLMHPDFNQILRMCLRITNTTVMSNGVMINDKKARFLRKIDDESRFETIYRISIDSTNELKNDSYRGRGSFRKALCAIMSLVKYEFNPIISVVNYENRSREEIFEEFSRFFFEKGFEMDEINLKVIPFFDSNDDFKQIEEGKSIDFNKLDCSNSRIVAQSGVFSCPMLIDDYRARLGSSLDNCSSDNYLDCSACAVCVKAKAKAQVNDWM